MKKWVMVLCAWMLMLCAACAQANEWGTLFEPPQEVLEQAAIFPLYGQCNAEMISSAVTGVDFHPVALNRVFKDAKKSV